MSILSAIRAPFRARVPAFRAIAYIGRRAAALFAAVVVAVYLTILIANLGGQIDDFIRADIDYALSVAMKDMRGLTIEERDAFYETQRQAAYEAAGLTTPFPIRCIVWLKRGLTLDWGKSPMDDAGRLSAGSREILGVILQALPRSLLVFGVANFLLFCTSILIALPLTNRKARWLDKLLVALSPLSCAPAWVYGVVLKVVALRALGGALSGGTFDAWPDTLKLAYIPMILKHLLLPLLATFLSGLFQGIYTWRTYFQLHAQEDYVELARAKGLSPSTLERRYIMRPMLPALITSFALL